MSTTNDYNLVAAAKTRTFGGGKGQNPMDIKAEFGEKTFSIAEMESRLPKFAFKSIMATIENGAPLDVAVADIVAKAMKDWALEHGATHYTHWFQPLTGATAEKHDCFISPQGGGLATVNFSGKELIQGEPDASSFPSGGRRVTAEARGYTAWDPSSPAFIVENRNGNYLAIPTAFVSWTGEALDHKIPLLRSVETLNKEALRVLGIFGVEAGKVYTTVGTEQEYFLIDEEFYYRRPDLLACGRTLFGAKPPKGQELDDHYFGTIPERVLAYMLETERELFRLGIPVKTRHNEVAPSQYEIAPVFEDANLASDHQQLIMTTMKQVARRYGLICLLHEKPFAGINGSGKHNNWSMATDTGLNLLEPTDTPHSNLQFLFFCTAVIRAVHKHQDLLRISVASAGNDHRLGANEAPPAIMSVSLGEQLEAIYEQLVSGSALESREGGAMSLGTSVLPILPRHAGDRNRTSPFAFTGNKFEFRAVGSAQSVAFPNVVLNVIVADVLSEMADMLEAALDGKDASDEKVFSTAVLGVLREVATEAEPILFMGDNYSEEWHQEAERRGLLNLRNTVDALGEFANDKNLALFANCGVLSEDEVHSRLEVALEQYEITINTEAETAESIARTIMLPAAISYLSDLIKTTVDASGAGYEVAGVHKTTVEVRTLIDSLREAIDNLSEQNNVHQDDLHAAVRHKRDHVIPAMEAVRESVDGLEGVVPQSLWTLPIYRDTLFVH